MAALRFVVAVTGLLVLAQVQASSPTEKAVAARPTCRIRSLDVVHDEGRFVTDRNSALFTVDCSDGVHNLAEQDAHKCVKVTGPGEPNVRSVGYSDGSKKTFGLGVSWEVTYAGEVVVEMACELATAAGDAMEHLIPSIKIEAIDTPLTDPMVHRKLGEHYHKHEPAHPPQEWDHWG